MNNRRLITGALATLTVAGLLVVPSVLAAPYAGQYVGLYGQVSIDGSDGATYRVDVEISRPTAVNVGTQRELRLDVTRCVKTRCVGIGHHLKGLLADEITIADDFRSGSLRTVFGGRIITAVWRDPSTGPLPELTGAGVSDAGISTLPHPGVNPEVYRKAWRLDMHLDLGIVACPATDAYGYETTGADTVGRDLRETRTPEPLRLPAGLEKSGRRTSRCTPPPKQAAPSAAPSASPSPSTPGASPRPGVPLPIRREIVEIRRTRKSGIAVLALAGRITALDKPGFFAAMDVYRDDKGAVRSVPTPDLVDFGLTQEPIRYGHGSSTPLCNLPLVCILDKAGGELSFTLTVTDDTRTNNDWVGRTHYLLLEGTGFELESAAVGFSVKRRKGGFDRRTAVESDADGVATLSLHAEVFRAASIFGGPRGSVVVAQLPCEYAGGVGAASLSHEFDQNLLSVASPMTCGNQATGFNRDSHIRTATRARPGVWKLEGAVAGLTVTQTRLLVLNQ